MEKLDNYDVVTDLVKVPYELAYGRCWTKFMEGMTQETIYGTKCPQCGRLLVPCRSYCPTCFVELTNYVEVPSEGVLQGWCLINYRYYGMPTEPPFIPAFIKLDGTNCNFFHMLGGFDMSDPDRVGQIIKTGMRVKAVWAEEKKGHIFDIKYFTPVD